MAIISTCSSTPSPSSPPSLYQLSTSLTSSLPPFSSICPPSLQPLLTYMSQHHPQAWSWEPPMNLYHHNHHLYQAELEEAQYEREHMFEKPLTPSDVGKLNRLVIPKQHAEKYFPLDCYSGEKGLLLSFEDESGKTWRFRYSYWTSSQSYVLTKGWSRFVKEKKLDAGDVVLFERPRFGGHQLYIGCRRRGANESPSPAPAITTSNVAGPWSPVYRAATCSYPMSSSSCFSPVQQDCLLHAGDQRDGAVQNETRAPTTSKQFRLFGVNLECRPEPEPQTTTSTLWFFGQSPYQFMPTNASSSQL